MPPFLKDAPGGRTGNAELVRSLQSRASGTAYRVKLQSSARDERRYGELRRKVDELQLMVYKRQDHILLLHNQLTEIQQSRSWRLLAPLRFFGRVVRKLRSVLGMLKYSVRHAGGVMPLLRKAGAFWRARGTAALLRRALGLPDPAPARAETLTPATAKNAGAKGTALSPESPPPTLLFVSHEASRTGAPILLLEVAQLLKQALGVRCMFLLRVGGDLEAEFAAVGPTRVLQDPEHVDAALLRELARQNIGLIYSNTATNGKVQRDLKQLNRPILCHMHELGHSVERHFGGENLRAVLATTDLFLAGSGAVATYLRDQRKVPPETVTVAYPFVKVDDSLARVKASRAPKLMPEHGLVVGACGTVGWRKGTDLFLQLAHQVLQRTNEPVHFVWVGGPITHGEFAQLHYDAVQMGIRDRLVFPGAVDDHLAYLARFDIFVLPSREDPFPLVALDAASLGIPVVCFDKAGGTPELVESDAGVVVPYLDINRMADAVLELAANPARREQLGAAAAAKVRARYDASAAGRVIADVVSAHFVSGTSEPSSRPGGSTE